MNRFSKHLSLSVIVLSLVTHANTYGMLTNKLAKKQLLSFNSITKRTYRVPTNPEKTKEFRNYVYEATAFLIDNEDVQMKCAGLTFLNYIIDLESLTEKNPEPEKKTIALAAKKFSDPDINVQIAALKLICTAANITEKKRTFKLAAQTAKTAFISENSSVRKEAFNIFNILIHKRKAIKTVKKAADIAMTSKDEQIKRDAIELSIAAKFNITDETRS